MELLLIIISAVLLVLLWRGLGSSRRRAFVAHQESQIKLPGYLAVDIGQVYGRGQDQTWHQAFKRAEVRWVLAEDAWWHRYKRSWSQTRRKMLAHRTRLQQDIDQYIDPVECLQRMAQIVEHCLAETQTSPTDKARGGHAPAELKSAGYATSDPSTKKGHHV